MKQFTFAVFAVLLVAGKLPAQSVGRVAGQVSLGLLGTPVGFVAGGLITRSIARSAGQDDDKASSLAMVGAYTGAALATAVGPSLLAQGRGNYFTAVGGAVAGGLGSVLLVKLNKLGDPDSRKCRVVCLASTAAIFLLPSVGSTIAVNAARR